MESSINGIAIMGLNGSGKSTLAHALAKVIGYYEIDVEDYYFPEQKESRKAALDNNYEVKCNYLGELPYSVPRSKAEVQESIYRDVCEHSQFVISGVTMNWNEQIISHINIVFILDVPTEKRVQRVENRELKRFGTRVAKGGDMYNQQADFRDIIASRDLSSVLESAKKINCEIVSLDGTESVEENVIKILNVLANRND